MARPVRVLRSFGIPGIATAKAGETITLENEAIEYLLQYDTARPLIEVEAPAAGAPAAHDANNPLFEEGQP